MTLLAVAILAYPLIVPELRRREKVARAFFEELREVHKFKGKLSFHFRTGWPPDLDTPAPRRPPLASYLPDPAGKDDLQHWYNATRGSIVWFEDEASRRAAAMRWTDRAIALAGLVLAGIGTLLVILGVTI